MKEYIRILKEWYKLARPNKFWTFWAFATVLLTQICLLVAPIFAAKATVSITSEQFTPAIVNLIIVFAILLLRNFIWHLNYSIYSKIIKHSYNKINSEFIDKSLRAKQKNFKSTSKEKFLNIAHTDVLTVSDLADKLATISARFVILIVTIVIIFNINVIAGFIVIFADIINYFLLTWLNKKRAVYIKKIRESQDYQFETIGEIVDKRDSLIDLGLDDSAKERYDVILNKYSNNLHKRTFWDSCVDNWFYVFYHAIILLVTIFLVITVSEGQLSVETYFVIIAYITTGIENTNSIYTIIPKIRDVAIATERIKLIINFVERNKIEYGKNNLKDILGSVVFYNVNYGGDDEGNPELKNFSVLLKENQTHLILGNKKCGKRTVFNLLRRAIIPTKGIINFGGINITDYTKRAHQDNFSYVTTKPTFFKQSILDNLMIVEKDIDKIFEICKEIGVFEYIDNLPDKFDSDIDSLPYEKSYMISLTRMLLAKTEVIVLYEMPNVFTMEEKENIKNFLNKIHGTRTIIIFTAQEFYADLADKIIEIENGQIKQIKIN